MADQKIFDYKHKMKTDLPPKQEIFFGMGNIFGDFAYLVGNFGKHVLDTLRAHIQTSLRPEDRPESAVPTSSYTRSGDADAKCGLSLI